MAEPAIVIGYRPGSIGRLLDLQSAYHIPNHGFDIRYEAIVAWALSDFLLRFDASSDLLMLVDLDGEIEGGMVIDGNEPGSDFARLRWFILSDKLRGQGMGRKMMTEAMAFVDRQGHPGVYLTTVDGMDAARHLYEEFGFELVKETIDTTWGAPVTEQRFEWVRG